MGSSASTYSYPDQMWNNEEGLLQIVNDRVCQRKTNMYEFHQSTNIEIGTTRYASTLLYDLLTQIFETKFKNQCVPQYYIAAILILLKHGANVNKRRVEMRPQDKNFPKRELAESAQTRPSFPLYVLHTYSPGHAFVIRLMVIYGFNARFWLRQATWSYLWAKSTQLLVAACVIQKHYRRWSTKKSGKDKQKRKGRL